VSVNIFCPVCLRWDDIALYILTRTGRCACGVALELDSAVWAPDAPGYPDKMLALTGTGESRLKSWRRGDQLYFRPRGAWIAKTVVLTPERIELRRIIGKSWSDPLSNVRGFMPVQHLRWSETGPTWSGWICSLLLVETGVISLYLFDDLDAAALASRELSEAVRRLQGVAHPFR
jgi:hypothetical protein